MYFKSWEWDLVLACLCLIFGHCLSNTKTIQHLVAGLGSLSDVLSVGWRYLWQALSTALTLTRSTHVTVCSCSPCARGLGWIGLKVLPPAHYGGSTMWLSYFLFYLWNHIVVNKALNSKTAQLLDFYLNPQGLLWSPVKRNEPNSFGKRQCHDRHRISLDWNHFLCLFYLQWMR